MAQYPNYGYRRITNQLRKMGWMVNTKVVRRLMVSYQIDLIPTNHNIAYPDLLEHHKLLSPKQIWIAGIFSIMPGEFYLALILDGDTGFLRGWALSDSLGEQLYISALHMALASSSETPSMLHSEQGFEYSSLLYTSLLHSMGIGISCSNSGIPHHVTTRLMLAFRETNVTYSGANTLDNAEGYINLWIETIYNPRTRHGNELEYGQKVGQRHEKG